MERPEQQLELPHSNAATLQLSHPTPGEQIQIWTNSWASWGDSLDLPKYLKESQFLTTIPLARDGGMTSWVLVDKTLPPDERPILCSCESFAKRALASDADGNVDETIIHGVASVFCQPDYRGRGYAARHMRELAKYLRLWQSDRGRIIGSVLYSDIGKEYYAKLGWRPHPTNLHLDFPPTKADPVSSPPIVIRRVAECDLAELCERDEAMIRAALACPAPPGSRRRVAILPDLDHMLWHIRKEDFATRHLFGTVPQVKGAIAGPVGNQIWAIWTHRYYDRPDAESPDNVLYILRLVVERDGSANRDSSSVGGFEMDSRLHAEQIRYLEAVLQAAQAQAEEWKLDHVKLWNPSPWVRDAVAQLGLGHSLVERHEDSIASSLWYGEPDDGLQTIWINNEHYAWC